MFSENGGHSKNWWINQTRQYLSFELLGLVPLPAAVFPDGSSEQDDDTGVVE